MKSSGFLFVLLVLLVRGGAFARTSLVLESWREDDRTVWREKLIPAFEAAHPDIEVRFRPTAPADYETPPPPASWMTTRPASRTSNAITHRRAIRSTKLGAQRQMGVVREDVVHEYQAPDGLNPSASANASATDQNSRTLSDSEC